MVRPRTASDAAILDAAAAAVAESGPAAVTLAQIGARAGVTAAALSRRFGSRRELLLALARRSARELPERIAAAGDAGELIETFAALAGSITGAAEFANHLQFLLLDLTDPEFREVTAGYAAAVEEAIGVVLGATDPALPRAVHAAYNGALITWGMTGAGSAADAVREQLSRVLGVNESK